MVAETRLRVDDLIAPLFVREGIDEPQPIESLPGVVQHTQDSPASRGAASSAELGVPAVILFGVPVAQGRRGIRRWNPDGIVQLALAALRDEVGDDMVLIADLCVDEYTDHGHCGVVAADGSGRQRRHPRAVRTGRRRPGRRRRRHRRPVGMMDGQVGAIRDALDDDGLRPDASSWPTRPSTPRRSTARSGTRSTCTIAGGGDRKGYQQDPANAREAHRGDAGSTSPRVPTS